MALLYRDTDRDWQQIGQHDPFCGVGRVTHAMAAVADQVTGVDISPGMLDHARKRQDSGARFVGRLADERFDWLHSCMVFQHIPPALGFVILKDLLARLAPGGWTTLHFTVEGNRPRHGGARSPV